MGNDQYYCVTALMPNNQYIILKCKVPSGTSLYATLKSLTRERFNQHEPLIMHSLQITEEDFKGDSKEPAKA